MPRTPHDFVQVDDLCIVTDQIASWQSRPSKGDIVVTLSNGTNFIFPDPNGELFAHLVDVHTEPSEDPRPQVHKATLDRAAFDAAMRVEDRPGRAESLVPDQDIHIRRVDLVADDFVQLTGGAKLGEFDALLLGIHHENDGGVTEALVKPWLAMTGSSRLYDRVIMIREIKKRLARQKDTIRQYQEGEKVLRGRVDELVIRNREVEKERDQALAANRDLADQRDAANRRHVVVSQERDEAFRRYDTLAQERDDFKRQAGEAQVALASRCHELAVAMRRLARFGSRLAVQLRRIAETPTQLLGADRAKKEQWVKDVFAEILDKAPEDDECDVAEAARLTARVAELEEAVEQRDAQLDMIRKVID